MKRLLREIFLYISSFIPLYFLIIVKELIEIANDNLTFNVTNCVMLSLNFILIVLGIIGVVDCFKNLNYKKVKVLTYKNVTQLHFLSYFPLFVLFALAFELEFISMAVVYVLILIMVGVVYVKNKLFYINPFLNIIGFCSYEIIFKLNGKEEKKIVLSMVKGERIKMMSDIFVK